MAVTREGKKDTAATTSHGDQRVPPSGKPPARVKDTPLPWGQLAILCVVLLTESICSTVLIPFTPAFVAYLQNWDIDFAGYAAGFPVGLFMLGQVLSGKMWSSVSDKVGRVIGINVGVTGCAICMFFFGLGGNIWTICFWRFMHGLVAGCSIIAKTMINDLTDTTNRAKGLALVSLTWGIGTLFGPAVGGQFYNPAPRFRLFNAAFFINHPAFLPSLIVALYNLFAVVISTLFLHESNKAARPLCEVLPPFIVRIFGPVIRIIQPKLPCDEAVEVTVMAGEEEAGNEQRSAVPADRAVPNASPANAAALPPTPHHSFGFKQAFQSPLLRRVLIISMLISLSDMTFAQIFPLWCAAAVEKGGMNYSPGTIANLVLVNSIPAVCANVIFAKTIQVVGGPILLWKIAQVLYGALTCIMPIATSMRPIPAFFYIMAVGMARKVVECWCFGLIMLVVSMTAPPGKVGMMFGIQQSTACMVRCGVPFVFAPLFAWSIQPSHVFPFNHYLTFLLCLVPLLVSAYMSHFVYVPSDDGTEEEGEDAVSPEAVDNEAGSSARRSGMGSGRGSVRSRYSFFGSVPSDARERESLLVNNSYANLANSCATNIVSGMPQNTILAIPVGSVLRVTGENVDDTGLAGEGRDGADSRDASSQEGDEVDSDVEYASVNAEMADVRAATGEDGREGEGCRMAQRGNKSEEEELPL